MTVGSATGWSGAGVAGAGWVDRPCRALAPHTVVDEVVEGAATDGSVVADGFAEGDGRSEEDLVGDLQQGPHITIQILGIIRLCTLTLVSH